METSVQSEAAMLSAEQPTTPLSLIPPQGAPAPGTRELQVLLALKAALEAGGAEVRLTGDSPALHQLLTARSKKQR